MVLKKHFQLRVLKKNIFLGFVLEGENLLIFLVLLENNVISLSRKFLLEVSGNLEHILLLLTRLGFEKELLDVFSKVQEFDASLRRLLPPKNLL